MKKIILLFLAAAAAASAFAASPYRTLVFEDNFDTPGLPDSTRWSYEHGRLRNHELQYYTVARPENVVVADGSLRITTLADSALIDGDIRPITSGSIHTKDTFAFQYGRVEVRAKLPSCLGTWPAIWLMPQVRSYGPWPRCGEIDIMENVGYDPEKINYAVHTEAHNHMKHNGKGGNAWCPDNATEYHVYGFEWSPESLTWTLDGRKRLVLTRPDDASIETWPFDQPFYLILNVAFGGGWGGQRGVASDELPQTFDIDWVRIYQ